MHPLKLISREDVLLRSWKRKSVFTDTAVMMMVVEVMMMSPNTYAGVKFDFIYSYFNSFVIIHIFMLSFISTQ